MRKRKKTKKREEIDELEDSELSLIEKWNKIVKKNEKDLRYIG